MKKKSLFSILYSITIWFIFCFIYQSNSLDTIKSVFDKGINAVKKGYNWLRGESQPPSINFNPIINNTLKKNNNTSDNNNEKNKIIEQLNTNQTNPNTNKESFFDFLENKINTITSSESFEKKTETENEKEKIQKINNLIDNKKFQEKMLSEYIERTHPNKSDDEKQSEKKQIINDIKENQDTLKNIKKSLLRKMHSKNKKNRAPTIKNIANPTQNVLPMNANNQTTLDISTEQTESQKKTLEKKEKGENEINQKIENLLIKTAISNKNKNENKEKEDSDFKKKYYHLLGLFIKELPTISQQKITNKNNAFDTQKNNINGKKENISLLQSINLNEGS